MKPNKHSRSVKSRRGLPATVRAAQRSRRLIWLMTNYSIWKDYEIGPRTEGKRILFEMLEQAGLYSPTTNWFDSNVDRLAKEAGEMITEHRLSMHLYDRIHLGEMFP